MILKKIDRKQLWSRLYITKLGNTKSFPCSWKNSCRIFNHTCPVAVSVLRFCPLSFVRNFFHSLLGQSFPQMFFLSLMLIHTHCFILFMAESKIEEEGKRILCSLLLSIKPVVEIQNESLGSLEHSCVAPEKSQSSVRLQHENWDNCWQSKVEVPGWPSSPRDGLAE